LREWHKHKRAVEENGAGAAWFQAKDVTAVNCRPANVCVNVDMNYRGYYKKNSLFIVV